MKIIESKYKNISALRLETEKYVALVLPSEGGKIASFQDKANGKEYLLQNPSPAFLHIGITDDFEKGECSGFDDMFPTIDSVSVDGKAYPDHGEICRVPFSYAINGETLVLQYRSEKFGYDYKKRFEEGEDGRLRIVYKITNERETEFRALWSAHCLVRAELGGRVIVPFAENEPVDFVDDSSGRIEKGTRLPYRREYLVSAWRDGEKRYTKLYFPKKCARGVISYRYPAGDEFVMEFDESQLPYIGVWQDYGMINGAFYVGLEPCTHGYDTVVNAAEYGQKRVLKSKETLKFSIEFYVLD